MKLKLHISNKFKITFITVLYSFLIFIFVSKMFKILELALDFHLDKMNVSTIFHFLRYATMAGILLYFILKCRANYPVKGHYLLFIVFSILIIFDIYRLLILFASHQFISIIGVIIISTPVLIFLNHLSKGINGIYFFFTGILILIFTFSFAFILNGNKFFDFTIEHLEAVFLFNFYIKSFLIYFGCVALLISFSKLIVVSNNSEKTIHFSK
jgi:hypothetical protein